MQNNITKIRRESTKKGSDKYMKGKRHKKEKLDSLVYKKKVGKLMMTQIAEI